MIHVAHNTQDNTKNVDGQALANDISLTGHRLQSYRKTYLQNEITRLLPGVETHP